MVRLPGSHPECGRARAHHPGGRRHRRALRHALRDLPALAVATFGQSRLPPRHLLEMRDRPGSSSPARSPRGGRGLRSTASRATPALSRGYRYNARVLARHRRKPGFGFRQGREPVDPGGLVPYRSGGQPRPSSASAPYLARVINLDRDNSGIIDEGISRCNTFLDSGVSMPWRPRSSRNARESLPGDLRPHDVRGGSTRSTGSAARFQRSRLPG